MKKLGNLFLQGLIAILPIVATVSILYWLGAYTEAFLGGMLKLILPEDWYRPGMGLLAGILVTFAAGLLIDAYLFKKFGEFAENILFRIPFVKTIYNGVRDIAQFLSSRRQDKDLRTAVLVRLNDDIRVIGFITRDSVPFTTNEESVAVYLPMSYQIGGYTLFLPKSRLEPLNMSIEEAMRMVLTAGMSKTSHVFSE